MKLIFSQIKKLLPSLNRRRQTWRMVKSACKKLGALLFNIPLKLDGYYIPPEVSSTGKPEIYINSNLSEDLQIATAVHEIKHAAFDTAINSILFSYRNEWTAAARRRLAEHRKFEFEACALGAIALLPEPNLKHASRGLFEVDDEFIADIWKIRLLTREIYGI